MARNLPRLPVASQTSAFFVLALVASLAAAAIPARAQTPHPVPPAPDREPRIIPDAKQPMPFPPGAVTLPRPHSIAYLTVDQMVQADRNLAAEAESSIAEHAGFADIEFNQGKWTYGQLVCPALPNHLFLRFTQNNGVGDVSVFSASVPRNNNGRVRIIPIQRRSYSLFSPAPINALTISAFNRIRREEQAESPAWLGTALCYAALAGGSPEAAPPGDPDAAHAFPTASAPILEIPSPGGAVIRFTDIGPEHKPTEWSMTFNGKGTLLKATHNPVTLAAEKPVQPTTVDQQARLVAANTAASGAKPIAPATTAQPVAVPAYSGIPTPIPQQSQK